MACTPAFLTFNAAPPPLWCCRELGCSDIGTNTATAEGGKVRSYKVREGGGRSFGGSGDADNCRWRLGYPVRAGARRCAALKAQLPWAPATMAEPLLTALLTVFVYMCSPGCADPAAAAVSRAAHAGGLLPRPQAGRQKGARRQMSGRLGR